MARALLMEGFRRMADYGIERSYMHSGLEFYRKIGFQPLPYRYYPWIKYMER